MAGRKLKVVHYLNQFFGQQGGEEKADIPFLVKSMPIGPGRALQNILGDQAEVVGTVICGDNYFAENIEKASQEGLKLIEPFSPDLFFAGPAFEAGRYGISCGAICKIVQERLHIPAITGMYDENPGVDLYRRDAYISKSGKSAINMIQDLTRMVKLGIKLTTKIGTSHLLSGENLGDPVEDEFFSRRNIRNKYVSKTQAERSVDMLLAKLSGVPFITEVEMPKFRHISPPSPLRDLTSSTITIISDGGITKKGNPDRFSGRGDNGWASYPVNEMFPSGSSKSDIEIIHTGYSHIHVLANINRLIPIDILRDLEAEGKIGRLDSLFYSTSGNAVSLRCAHQIGQEMAQDLKNREISGAILTST
jgi:glycine reductase complex component B subunit gamma